MSQQQKNRRQPQLEAEKVSKLIITVHQHRQQLQQTAMKIQTVFTVVWRIYLPKPERSGDNVVNAVDGLTRSALESAIKINISHVTSVLIKCNLTAVDSNN